ICRCRMLRCARRIWLVCCLHLSIYLFFVILTEADYAIRATDNKGEKLPKSSLVWSLVVATAAGFTTTSSLLSWLTYGLCTYPGMQERLLQELIDNDIDDTTPITADVTDRLSFLDKYIKETQRRHNPSFQP